MSLLFGLDGLPLTEPKTGVGHYTFELARALAEAAPSDRFELSYPSTYPAFELKSEEESPVPPNLRAERVGVGPFGRHWWACGLPVYVRRRGIRLFHGTNYDVPLWNVCPTVLTIHDLSLLLHPSTHEARRVRRARRRLPLMARQATLVITPTESVRQEVCEHLKVSPSKTVAVPEAPRAVFRRVAPEEAREHLRRFGIEEDEQFLLAVGTIEPRKNLLTLVRAFEEIARDRPQLARLRFVVAGPRGWLTNELFARVAASSSRPRTLFTGYVSDADLRAFYSSCTAFVYPSLYEGFGLPPLEAMACGAPVIASRIPSLLETAGEAARLVPPTDAAALARAIIGVAESEAERERLRAAGQKRVAEFSWRRAAERTLEVYAEAFKRAARGKAARRGEVA